MVEESELKGWEQMVQDGLCPGPTATLRLIGEVRRLRRLLSTTSLLAEGVPSEYSDSLEQPSPLRVVPSITTYGAHEDPM